MEAGLSNLIACIARIRDEADVAKIAEEMIQSMGIEHRENFENAGKILSAVEGLEETVDSAIQELQKISGRLAQTKRELKEMRDMEDKLLPKEQVCLKAQETVDCCEMILDLLS